MQNNFGKMTHPIQTYSIMYYYQHVIGWNYLMEPSIFVSGVRAGNHFELDEVSCKNLLFPARHETM